MKSGTSNPKNRHPETDPIDVDRLIREDRAGLLEGYGSEGEGGKKRAAALLLVAGSEAARGATGLIGSGFLGIKGLWLGAGLLGIVGAGLISLEILGSDAPQQNLPHSGERVEEPVIKLPMVPSEPPSSVVADTIPTLPAPRPGRISSGEPQGEKAGDEGTAEVSPSTPASVENDVDRDFDRDEEIRTRATIDYGD